MNEYLLRLYIAGHTERSDQAVNNIKNICDSELNGYYQLEVIDVLLQPQLAEDEKILATPTLVKELPPPLRRIVGDLSDRERVLIGLQIIDESQKER